MTTIVDRTHQSNWVLESPIFGTPVCGPANPCAQLPYATILSLTALRHTQKTLKKGCC